MTQGKYPDKKLANLIIAGVNKAGSTSLFHYLSAHPEICGSIDKETCYFLPVLYNQPISGISEYENQFNHCTTARYRLEATPGYVTGGKVMASTIAETLGNVKIIIILKDPVERLVSFYKRKKATLQLPENLSFSEYVSRCQHLNSELVTLQENHVYSAIANGEYANFLEPWLQQFGSDIKIVFFDDFINDTLKFMSDVSDWLDIDPAIYSDFDFDIKNKSMNYKNQALQFLAVHANRAGQRFWRTNPLLKKNLVSLYYKFNGASFSRDEIDSDTLNILQQHYLPHNQRLQLLLSQYGINVNKPSWLEPVTVPA